MNEFVLYPNRTICGVLDDMRRLHETRNYSSMLSLIEEVQTMANRMEASLYDFKDIKQAHELKRKLKNEIKKLNLELNKLKPEEKE